MERPDVPERVARGYVVVFCEGACYEEPEMIPVVDRSFPRLEECPFVLENGGSVRGRPRRNSPPYYTDQMNDELVSYWKSSRAERCANGERCRTRWVPFRDKKDAQRHLTALTDEKHALKACMEKAVSLLSEEAYTCPFCGGIQQWHLEDFLPEFSNDSSTEFEFRGVRLDCRCPCQGNVVEQSRYLSGEPATTEAYASLLHRALRCLGNAHRYNLSFRSEERTKLPQAVVCGVLRCGSREVGEVQAVLRGLSPEEAGRGSVCRVVLKATALPSASYAKNYLSYLVRSEASKEMIKRYLDW